MAIIFSKTSLFGNRFGVWEIEEDAAFFLEKLKLSDAERSEFARIHGVRGLEWLAGRLLLHKISDHQSRTEIAKTASGQPFWAEKPGHFFSISHTDGKLAAAVVGDRPCGIDVQVFTEKIRRVAHRILNENELKNELTDDYLHQTWGAKEAMFKAWGRGGVDFRHNLTVGAVENGRATGIFRRGDFSMGFDLLFEKIEVGGLSFMLSLASKHRQACERF